MLDTYFLYYENLVPDELIVHPQFDASTYEHDVRIVEIRTKSTFPPPHPKTNPEKIIHHPYLLTASLLERLHKHRHIFLAVQECSEPL